MKAIFRWLCSNSSKNLFVKIVHPGGHVELHDRPILASELLDRNPKCCVAHPTVFQQPYAIVSPQTTLILGHKYYVVPLGTVRKLQLKYPRVVDDKNDDHDLDSSSVCWLFRNSKDDEKEKNERSMSVRAKIRATSSESVSEYTNTGSKKKGGSSSSSPSPGRMSLVSEV